MFNKILIANRGEIALRIIRACKEMGIATVAVYSEADSESLHVHYADEAICVGPAAPNKSYLNIKSIISAALVTGADAIHPGYGFLSENSKLVDICNMHGIKFIGPKKSHIERMGDKAEARKTMIEAGVPVVPGSEEATTSAEEAKKVADDMGYPVIVKASAGGGGRGMRIIFEADKFIENFNTAKSEAKLAFNDDSMYVEKFIQKPRHIEFQIMADEFGNVVHLGERDCSLQRRNQKVLEESPCTLIDEELRKKMGESAIKAAKAVGYMSAGTIEFLLDSDGQYYFIEMNTRIQVEHPVTEMVTGIDLIKTQIEIAYGQKLKFTQDDIQIRGHAIECRINAEKPSENFRPSPGTIDELMLPGGNGTRLDTFVYPGYKIPSNYDSMIGKLIVWASDREEAISRMKRALDEFYIFGIDNNIEFQLEILDNEDFKKNNIYTSFIENEILGS